MKTVGRVTVWANGYGVFHVRVPRSVVWPLGAARRALREELTVRDAHVDRAVWMNAVRVPELDDANGIVWREGDVTSD